MKIPRTYFSTRLSGSAKETELRIRNIVQWKKKRPPVVLLVLTFVVLLSCFSLFSCTPREDISAKEPPVVTTPSAEPTQPEEEPALSPEPETTKEPAALDALLRTENWSDCYRMILQDWTVIEGLFDFGYLQFYFGDGYGFDSYYLYDVDRNGTPELFLGSSTMRLTAVLTYTDQPVFLLYEDIYAINPETAEIVVRGHWHGAGGSGTNEWHAHRISGGTPELTLSMDWMPYGYSVYALDTLGFGQAETQEAYEAQYAVHVRPAIPAERFKPCALSDLSGLAAAVIPGDAYYYTMHCADGELLIVELEGGELPDQPDCYQVDQIRVFCGGELIQSIPVAELGYEGEYLYDGLFILRGESRWKEPVISDYNFDGSDDIVFLATGFFPKNIPYAYFLWDEDARRLEFSFVLVNSVSAYNGEVTEQVVEGPAGAYLRENIYKYDETGQLVLMSSEIVNVN